MIHLTLSNTTHEPLMGWIRYEAWEIPFSIFSCHVAVL